MHHPPQRHPARPDPDPVYPLPPMVPRARGPSTNRSKQEASNPDMAKRARGSVRPGQRRPIDRRPASANASAPAPAAASGAAAPVAPRPSGLTEAETARAAELEAQLLAEERAAETARKRTQQPRTVRDGGPAGSIALSAETEYAYVARDVKDIVRIATLLLGILFALWIVIDIL